MKKIKYLFIFLIIFMISMGCQQSESLLSPKDDTGKVTLNIGAFYEGENLVNRTVMPGNPLSSISKYVLYGCLYGGTETELKTFTSLTGASIMLDLGTWSFTLKTFDSSDKELLSGTISSIVISGATTMNFTLKPLTSGKGSVSVEITLPTGHEVSYYDVKFGSDTSVDLTPSSGKILFAKNNIDTSEYLLFFKLKDSAKNVSATVSEIVRIKPNLLSSKSITLALTDFNAKPNALSDLTAELVSSNAAKGSVKFDWTDSVTNETEFIITWNDGSTTGDITGIAGGSDTYTWTEAERGKTYKFKIKAKNDFGSSDYTAEETVVIPSLFTVNFNTNGGSTVNSQNVEGGGLVTEPALPTYGSYIFSGWYKESSFTNLWIFASDKVTADITLYAKWSITKPTLTNAVTESPKFNSIKLDWDDVPGAEYYEIVYGTVDNSSDPANLTVGTDGSITVSEYLFENLTPGQYYFWIRAKTSTNIESVLSPMPANPYTAGSITSFSTTYVPFGSVGKYACIGVNGNFYSIMAYSTDVNKFSVMKVKGDTGEIDTTFGTNGFADFPFPRTLNSSLAAHHPYQILIQNSSKVLMYGWDSTASRYKMYEFHPDTGVCTLLATNNSITTSGVGGLCLGYTVIDNKAVIFHYDSFSGDSNITVYDIGVCGNSFVTENMSYGSQVKEALKLTDGKIYIYAGFKWLEVDPTTFNKLSSEKSGSGIMGLQYINPSNGISVFNRTSDGQKYIRVFRGSTDELLDDIVDNNTLDNASRISDTVSIYEGSDSPYFGLADGSSGLIGNTVLYFYNTRTTSSSTIYKWYVGLSNIIDDSHPTEFNNGKVLTLNNTIYKTVDDAYFTFANDNKSFLIVYRVASGKIGIQKITPKIPQSITATINLGSEETIDFTPADKSVNKGSTLAVSVTAITGATYKWYIDGVESALSTTNSISIDTTTGYSAKQYTLTLVVTKGSVSSSGNCYFTVKN